MQKFTRAITREIELEGSRIAVTLDEKGVSMRIVGTRRSPVEITWADLVSIAVRQGRTPATPEDLAQAIETMGGAKKGAAAAPSGEPASPAPATEPPPESPPGADTPVAVS